MTNYLGDYAEDATINFMWSSNDSNGAAITRATNGTISVYKANSTTQSTAGITDTEDFDTLTGIHHVRIDTSADAFYATANDYMVVLSAATIDGQTVNAVLAQFSIENRYMRGTDGANTTTPPTAVSIRSEIDTNSTQLTAILTDTNQLETDLAALQDISTTDVQTAVATALNTAIPGSPTADSINERLQTLDNAYTAARAALLDNLDAAIGTRLAAASYTAPDNASITAILADTNELQTDNVPGLIAGLNNLDSAAVETAVNAALVALHLDHLLAATYDPASKPGAANALLNELIEDDSGVSRFTANALEQGPSSGGTPLTAQQVRDAMGLDHSTGITASASIDAKLTAIPTAITSTETNIRGADNDTLKTISDQIDAIPGATAGAIEVTDILIDDGTNPVEGAEVWITTDGAGNNIIWYGTTNASGQPKDAADNNPWLDTGTYYIWVQHGNHSFTNPTSKTVS